MTSDYHVPQRYFLYQTNLFRKWDSLFLYVHLQGFLESTNRN